MLSISSNASSRQFSYQYAPLAENTIEGEGFTAHVLENGVIARAISVDYSIPRPQIETLLFGKGYDLRGCEWNFSPNLADIFSARADQLADLRRIDFDRDDARSKRG